MAVKTYRVTAAGMDGLFADLVESDQTAANRTPDGWTVAKIASGSSADFRPGTKLASGNFNVSAKPASFVFTTISNAFKTPAALSGDFANTAWTFTFAMRAFSSASAQAGRIRLRVFKSVNADGSAATELTGATQVGTTTVALTTSADGTSIVTWSPGAITLSNEYLFFVIAWEITTASGSNTGDVIFRTGQAAGGSRIVTPDLATPAFVSGTDSGAGSEVGYVLFPSYHERIVNQTSGVLSFWELQEAAGASSAADSKGSNSGTPDTTSGSVTFGSTGLIAEGNAKSVRLAKGNLNFGDVLDITGTAAYTWEAWVKMNSFPPTSNHAEILSKRTFATTADANEFFVDSTHLYAIRGNGSINAGPLHGWSTGQIHHVVLAVNPGVNNAKTYIDGVQVDSTSVVGSANDTTNPFRLGGGDPAGSDQFDGWMSHAVVYNRQITAAEVLGNYKQGLFSPPIFVTGSDSNGATTESAIATPAVISGSDSGTSVETATELYLASGADVNGTTTEIASPRYLAASADTNGVTTETFAIAVPVAGSDAGSDSETATVLFLATGSDASGAGAQLAVLTAVLSDTDFNITNIGSENAAKNVANVGADSGSSSEIAAMLSLATDSDASGAGAQSATANAVISGADVNGVTAENGVVNIGTLSVSDVDSGSGSEVASRTAVISATDVNGASTEIAAFSASIAGTDSGTSSEIAALRPSAADSGTSVETALAGPVIISASDSGTSSETASAAVAATQTGVAQISLASGGTPVTQTAHSIKIRARVQSGNGKIRAQLWEGSNQRAPASGYIESSALSNSLADYTLAIADADAATITDYSNLEIRFWGYSAGGETNVYEVDQLWLETPVISGATVKSGTDTNGSTTENAAFSYLPAGLDSGSSSEIAAIAVAALDSNGVTVENATLRLVGIDSGIGSDNAVLLLAGADTGSGSENAVIQLSSADTGAGSEIAAMAAQIPATDANSATIENGSTSTNTLKNDSDNDANASVENAVIAYSAVGSDSGAGTESAGKAMTVADAGAGTDTASRQGFYAVSDAGTGSEASSLSASLTGADSGSETDAASAGVPIAGTDVGHGVEILTYLAHVAADAGAGSEASSRSAVVNAADLGGAIDFSTLLARVAGNDGSVSGDIAAYQAFFTGFDGGIFNDDATTFEHVTNIIEAILSVNEVNSVLLGVESQSESTLSGAKELQSILRNVNGNKSKLLSAGNDNDSKLVKVS